jgi:hypothetical protein
LCQSARMEVLHAPDTKLLNLVLLLTHSSSTDIQVSTAFTCNWPSGRQTNFVTHSSPWLQIGLFALLSVNMIMRKLTVLILGRPVHLRTICRYTYKKANTYSGFEFRTIVCLECPHIHQYRILLVQKLKLSRKLLHTQDTLAANERTF